MNFKEFIGMVVMGAITILCALSYTSWNLANMYMSTSFEVWISFLASLVIIVPLAELSAIGLFHVGIFLFDDYIEA